MFVCLVALLALIARHATAVLPSVGRRSIALRQRLFMAAPIAEYSELESKLLKKKEVTSSVGTKNEPTIEKSPKVAALAKPVVAAPAKPVVAAPAKSVVATPAKSVVAAPAKPVVAAKTKDAAIASSSVAVPVKEAVPTKPAVVASPPPVIAIPPTSASSLPSFEFIAGLGLGLAPYIVVPVLAFNALKGLVKEPKPLPVVEVKPPKVNPYSKPIAEGLKEGVEELISGKQSRRGILFSLAGFGSAAVLAGALIATAPAPEVPKVAQTVTSTAPVKAAPASKVPAPVVVPAPASKAPAPVVVPAPAPVVIPAPAPIVPAPAPVVAPAPAPVVPAPAPVVVPAPIPAPVVVPAPAPVVVPAPAPVVPAPAPVVVPAPAPVVPAPAPVVVPAPASLEKKIPKGLEAETVDVEALKALRVSDTKQHLP